MSNSAQSRIRDCRAQEAEEVKLAIKRAREGAYGLAAHHLVAAQRWETEAETLYRVVRSRAAEEYWRMRGGYRPVSNAKPTRKAGRRS